MGLRKWEKVKKGGRNERVWRAEEDRVREERRTNESEREREEVDCAAWSHTSAEGGKEG